jgi:hypothetical protein
MRLFKTCGPQLLALVALFGPGAGLAQTNGDQFQSASYCTVVTDYATYCDFIIGVSSLTYAPSTGAVTTSALTEPVWGFLINVTECEDQGGEQLGDCIPFQPAVWAYVDTTVQPGGTTGSATSTSGEAQLALPTSGTLQVTQAGTWSETSTHAATFDPPDSEPYGTTQTQVPVPPSITGISPSKIGASSQSDTITLTGAALGGYPAINIPNMGSFTGYGSSTGTSATFTVYPVLYDLASGAYQVTATANGLTSNAAQLNVVCAVPTNFQPYGPANGSCQANGDLIFYYTYSSSTGNQADISGCGIFESVTYAPFPPPSPPWPPGGAGYVNPTTNLFPASGEGALDNNYPPSGNFVTPYSASAFAGLQWWGYTCSCAGNAPVVFPGYSGIAVSRTVFNPGPWVYVVSKSGGSCGINLPTQ